MATAEIIQRVRIYLSREDQWEGSPLYLAIMEQLRRSDATGATALQGLAGFGPGQRIRPANFDRPESRQPVVIEWIDRVERVARLLPMLDELIANALVTVEDVPIYQATLRARGPFAADRSVGDLMRSPAPAVQADAPLSEALAVLLAQRLATLPIVDHDGRLAGLLSEQELSWRAGLRLAPRLLGLLEPSERDTLLAPLVGRSVGEIMNSEPRSVVASTTIAQALVPMVEWGYAEIPVIDRNGILAGLLGQTDVLRAAIEQSVPDDGPVRDAEPPIPVSLVMQAVAPQLPDSSSLAQAIGQILGTPGRRLLVVGQEGRLLGAIDDARILRSLSGSERGIFLTALQRPESPQAGALPGAERGLDSIIDRDLQTLDPGEPLIAAARRLIDLDTESLPVVDTERKLLGIIARGGLIRALLQQSE